MAEMLSPGVFITEVDASTIAPSVSNSIAVFAGNFHKGPVGEYTLVTSVDDLISTYGLPSDENYNDWYQVWNFLQYGNKVYVSRAANVNGTSTLISGVTFAAGARIPSFAVTGSIADESLFEVGRLVKFETAAGLSDPYMIVDNTVDYLVDRDLPTITVGAQIHSYVAAANGVAEAPRVGEAPAIAEILFANNIAVGNADEFENIEPSIVVGTNSKLKFIARNPGKWSNAVEIAIAKPDAFGQGAQAFSGIALDDLFEYQPSGSQVGIVIAYEGQIREIFVADFDTEARDVNGKSAYIEAVINGQSNYVFVKENALQAAEVSNCLFELASDPNKAEPLVLVLGQDSSIQADDLMAATDLFANKEEVDIDIVIASELDPTVAANLADARKDCIAFVGARHEDVVGKKASEAVANAIEWRKTGELNFNSMFVVAAANRKYQYDRYNDKNRWINIAGDIAGLRAQTSTNRASWWASAGLERGQIKNVKKLAFNPNQAQRDVLYKSGLNPVCSFPGQGTVLWGQKTLLDKPSSFDRVNVRGLFNTLERSLGKMAKYQVMEFNDNFTRNRIVSMIKPFLQSVQAGRGIQDFVVICDESNNTADVISRNQLVVDIYVKPTYVAEFVHLRFTNAGTNSFSEVVGG